MKKILVFLAMALAIVSCTDAGKATVNIVLDDAADSTAIVVSKLSLNKTADIDTLYVLDHSVSFSTECTKGLPDFYYFFNDGKKIVSLVLQAGDRIKVEADINGNVSSISGSEESSLYQEVEKQFAATYSNFGNLATELLEVQQTKDKKAESAIKVEMGRAYVAQKQYAIKYAYTNPKSITVIPVLYQRFSPELVLFAEPNDVFLFKRVYDSLMTVYPHSPYVISLADDIERKERLVDLDNKLNMAVEASFPNISLYDRNAVARNLSDLEGNVILLSFWTVTEPAQKIFNAELKNIYDKYHSKGFEVYQVSIDNDKTAWARAIKDQGLEWISVCDPGNLSQSTSLYNLEKIPAIFIIDRNGNIIAKDLFNVDKLDQLIKSLVR